MRWPRAKLPHQLSFVLALEALRRLVMPSHSWDFSFNYAIVVTLCVLSNFTLVGELFLRQMPAESREGLLI